MDIKTFYVTYLSHVIIVLLHYEVLLNDVVQLKSFISDADKTFAFFDSFDLGCGVERTRAREARWPTP